MFISKTHNNVNLEKKSLVKPAGVCHELCDWLPSVCKVHHRCCYGDADEALTHFGDVFGTVGIQPCCELPSSHVSDKGEKNQNFKGGVAPHNF